MSRLPSPRALAFALSVIAAAAAPAPAARVAPVFAPAPAAPAPAAPDRPRVLVVTGANNHDWRFTSESLRTMLEESGRFVVDLTVDPAATFADAARLQAYAAFVLDYNGPRWGEPAEARFLDAVRAGAGVVVVHAANNAFRDWVEYERLVGLMWREGTSHGTFHAFDVTITDRDHPITATLPDLVAHPDELYHGLVRMHDAEPRVLATAWSDPATRGSGAHEPMLTVDTYGKGRVVHTPLGHVWEGVEASKASHADPQLRDLIVRAVEWAATGSVVDGPLGARAALRDDVERRSLLLSDAPDLWRPIGDALYEQEGDAIHGRVGGGTQSFLVTNETFGDFVLEVDVRAVGPGNAGVQVRSHVGDDGVLRGPQIEIDPSERAWSGGLYDEARRGWLDDLSDDARARAAFVPGEWNRYRVECVGPSIRAWVNGVPTADALDGLDLSGVIGLQVHAGTDTDVLWRTPRLTVLGPAWTWDAAGLADRRLEGGTWSGPGPRADDPAPRTDATDAVRCELDGNARIVLSRPAGEGSRRFALRGSAALGLAPRGGATALTIAPGDDPEAWRTVHVHAYGRRLAVLVDGRTLLDDHEALAAASGATTLEVLGETGAWLELKDFATLVAP